MAFHVGKPPHLLLTMVGLTTARWPCQPTNPPPKRYKPPSMTRGRSHSIQQQHNIHQKITGHYCGASTFGYTEAYGQFSTNTGNPTMTPPNGTSQPTLHTNIEKNEHQLVSNTTTNITTIQKVKAFTRPVAITAVVSHKTEPSQLTTQTSPPPLSHINGRNTNKIDTSTRTTSQHSTNTSISSIPPSIITHARKNQHTTIPELSLHHSKASTYHSQSHHPTLSNPVHHSTKHSSSDPPNKLNHYVNPSQNAKQVSLQTNPPSTPDSSHPSPPPIKHNHQNYGTETSLLAMNPFNQDQCIRPTKPTLLPPPQSVIDPSTATLTSIPSLSNLPLMQSLMQKLAITKTLVDRLCRMIPLLFNNASSKTTEKDLFELIADLPSHDPLPLLITPSSTSDYECLTNSPLTCDKYRYWYDRKSMDYENTRTNPTIIIWSMVHFTTPYYSKDLLKVP